MWPRDGQFRTPSLPELRSMAWQAICAGANGVVFYSFFEALKPSPQNLTFAEQWSHLKTAAAEISAHAAALLGPAAPGPAHSAASGWWRMTRAHWVDETRGVYQLFAVSDGKGGGRTVFELPWPIAKIEVLAHNSAQNVTRVIEPIGSGAGRAFSDEIPPLGLAVYRVALKTAAKSVPKL